MKTEPRRMTLGDMISLAVGVALAITIVSRFDVTVSSPTRPPGWLALLLTALGVSWFTVFTSSVVGVGREIAYRRPARPSEWLGIVSSIWMAIEFSHLRLDAMGTLITSSVQSSGDDLEVNPWWLAGLGLLVIGVGLGLLRLGRRFLPPWLKTMALGLMVAVGFWWPISVFSDEGANLVAPSQGFGPGDVSILYRGACLLFAQVPMGLMLGVPLAGALKDLPQRRSWTWIEWPGLVGSLILVTVFACFYRSELPIQSMAGIAERGMMVAWVAVVVWLSWMIVKRFGPIGNHWIGNSIPESAAITDINPSENG